MPLATVTAQINPNWSQANAFGYAGTYTTDPVTGVTTQNAAVCQSVAQVGATPSDPSTASISCGNTAALESWFYEWNSDSWREGPSLLNAGTFSLTSTALSDPASQQWSSASSLSGTVESGVEAGASATAFTWEYLRISNPTSVYRMALSASSSLSAGDAGTSASGHLVAFTVDPFYGYLSQYQGHSSNYVTDGSGSGSTCSASLECSSGPVTGNLSLEVAGSALNPNGIFAALLYAGTSVYGSNGAFDLSASANLSNLSLTLYERDEAGNVFDATSLHTITYDHGTIAAVPELEVVATPEPATFVLMGTGVLTVLGVSYRRRQKRIS